MYCKKSDSPKNAKQLYVNGKRYRSVNYVAEFFGIDFSNLLIRLRESDGLLEIKKLKIVSEKWILDNPCFLLDK